MESTKALSLIDNGKGKYKQKRYNDVVDKASS